MSAKTEAYAQRVLKAMNSPAVAGTAVSAWTPIAALFYDHPLDGGIEAAWPAYDRHYPSMAEPIGSVRALDTPIDFGTPDADGGELRFLAILDEDTEEVRYVKELPGTASERTVTAGRPVIVPIGGIIIGE